MFRRHTSGERGDGGSGVEQLTPDDGSDATAPDWSPDGTRIVYAVGQDFADLWVMDADGADQELLYGTSASEGAPVWSPDGRKLAFTKILRRDVRSGRPLESDIYVMNADGSGQRNLTRTPGGGSHESVPVWSPAQT